ncbi:NAD(P)-dependent oxidoreductase [Pseudarthrobacter sp. NIBRBAC000502772]|uniref:NAD-dependent epimerase/dehydratase family protein n=1 Tax=Pseudarthrobacter sp. NIBRBAC000502772 TaxID=2590775 RepID=UPI00113001FC|nr:NAD(P)-dependent oxidoreductase [Pseudarthrobacter sp. NIBRBAC000502772]QDG68087.1 NAD(P)-dependent oxidoreductase [Pseudarthrobacter sp. NIBRBAC000502772]
MRILVTGGSGFIGSNLVEKLVVQGHEVTNYDLQKPPRGTCAENWLEGDITDAVTLAAAYEKVNPQIVFHLAARTDLHGKTLSDYLANTVGTQNVIDAGRNHSEPIHTFYASSRLVFAIDHQPAHILDYKTSTVYGESKVKSEELILEGSHGKSTWTIIRPTSIWGPGFGVPYRTFFDVVNRGFFFNVRGADPKKSFGYIENSVHQLITLMHVKDGATHGKILWLTDDTDLGLRDWSEKIAKAFDRRRPSDVPMFFCRIAASVGDVLQRLGLQEPPLTSFRLRNMVTTVTYDSTETSELVGPLPFSVDEGTRRTVDWIRSTN